MPPDLDDPVQRALNTVESLQLSVEPGRPSYVGEPDPTRRQLTDSGLYSHAAGVVGRMPQAKGTPAQFRAMLLKQGVKPDELKWSGYDEKLGNKPMVTRDELKRHFNRGLPAIRETVHREGDGSDDLERRENGTAQYGEYTLPGGKNYRELLLHLPNEDSDTDAARAFKIARHNYGQNYNALTPEQKNDVNRQVGVRKPRILPYVSSHWEDTPNVLAHIRMSDRPGPGKRKALHVEELQSDWSQEGRQKGFQPAEGGVPHAPYVDSTGKWLDLALKRVLHEAAHGGHDRVLITPGSEQVKRYDLSQHFDQLMWDEMNKLVHAENDGDMQPAVSYPVEHAGHLPNIIGKDLAERLQKARIDPNTGMRTLRGTDLKVGGEGMKQFYDRLVPQALEKLARKHDPEARVQLHNHELTTQRPGRAREHTHNLHSLEITPKMRESIKRGQPAYASGGAVGTSADSGITRSTHLHPEGGHMHTYDVGEDASRLKRASGGKTATEPTEAQKQAGNYAKRKINFQGLPISIENAKGSTRSGVGPGGRKWSVRMPADYGYIKNTEGADGDHVDAYVGPHRDSPIAFIVNQHDHRSGKFDEHKVILGITSERMARDLYVSGFSDGHGPDRLGSLEPVSIDALKAWLRDRKKTVKPAQTAPIVEHALRIAAEATR